MSSKIAFKPRTYFLKRQSTISEDSRGRINFLLHSGHKPITSFSSNATKESTDLKVYAEKMMREQKVSAQKLTQLASSLQQMTRTIGLFFQNLEKRQTLIKTIATLKTENSRLKELIACKTTQVEQMSQQLETVSTAKQSLQDLITSLFEKLEHIKQTRTSICSILQCQQSKATETLNTLHQLLESLVTTEKEKDIINESIQALQTDIQNLQTEIDSIQCTIQQSEEEKHRYRSQIQIYDDMLNQITTNKDTLMEQTEGIVLLMDKTKKEETIVTSLSTTIQKEQDELNDLEKSLQKQQETLESLQTDITKEINELTEDEKTKTNQFNQMKNEVTQLTKEEKEQNSKIDEVKKQLALVQQQEKESTEKLKQNQTDYDELQKKKEEREITVKKMETECKDITMQLSELKKQDETLDNQLLTLKNEYVSININEKEDMIAKEKEKKRALDKEMQTICIALNIDTVDTVGAVDTVDTETIHTVMQQQMKERNDLQEQIEKTTLLINQLDKEEKKEMENQVESQNQLEKLKEKEKQYHHELKQLEEELIDLKNEQTEVFDATTDEDVQAIQHEIDITKKKNDESIEKIHQKFKIITDKRINELYEQQRELKEKIEHMKTKETDTTTDLHESHATSPIMDSFTPNKKTHFHSIRKQRIKSGVTHATFSSLSRKGKMKFEPVKVTNTTSKGDWFNDDFFN